MICMYVRCPSMHYLYLPLTSLPLGLLPDVPRWVQILCSSTEGYNAFPLLSMCFSESQIICSSPSGWISPSNPTPQKLHVQRIGHWTSLRPSLTIWYNSLKNLSSSPSFTNFSLSLLMLPFHCLLPHPWHTSLRFPWHTSILLSFSFSLDTPPCLLSPLLFPNPPFFFTRSFRFFSLRNTIENTSLSSFKNIYVWLVRLSPQLTGMQFTWFLMGADASLSASLFWVLCMCKS